MSFLYEHEWLFFMLSEGLTWVSVFLLLVSRYKFGFIRLSQFFLLFIILCTVFQGVLVGVDYYFTGTISLFQIVIILFIIYASTIGNADFKRLDMYIQEKLNKQQRIAFKYDIYEYLTYRRQLFFIHSIAFFMIHFVWILLDSDLVKNRPSYNFASIYESFSYTIPNFFNSQALNIISYLWIIVYFIDSFIFLIYIIWIARNR